MRKNFVHIMGDFGSVTAITIDGRNYDPANIGKGSPIIAESGGSAFYIGTSVAADFDCEIELNGSRSITIENGNLNFG